MPEGLFSLSKLGLGKERKRCGWFHRRTGVARYLPGCVTSLVRPGNKASGSIALLPSELLDAIFELLALSDHNTLSNCMQVCRHWHGIARLHFFAVVLLGYHRVDHFFQLLRTDPGLARHIKEVHFMDEWREGIHRNCYSRYDRIFVRSEHPFDIRLLSSILPTFGLVNLQYLSLVGFNNLDHHSPGSLAPVNQRPTRGQNNPSPIISLQQLTCHECLGLTLILPALLSLFSVDTLIVKVHPFEGSNSPWDIDDSVVPPASITIQNLVFDGATSRLGTEPGYYGFFGHILAPGSLRTLGAMAECLSIDEPRLHHFIRCDAARNMRSISVDASDLIQCPRAADGFKSLGDALAHCSRLECFRIRFTHGPYTAWWNHCCDPRTFAPILANLPGALRVFAIDVEMHEWRSWKEFRASAVGLKHVDQGLSPSRAPRGASGGRTRFPHLETVELNVFDGPTEGWQVRKPRPIKEPPRPTPLPRLKAAGLLRVRVVRGGANLPEHMKRAAFFLPPEVA